MINNQSVVFDDKWLPLRFVSMLLLGLVIAGFLTWFMYFLIQVSEQKMDESSRVHILDFVMLKREEASARKDQRMERPERTEAPPAPATPDTSDNQSDLTAIAVAQLPTGDGMNVELGGFGSGMGEGEYLPIVKVAPIYPSTAASRGIEGHCVVEYTVTTTGATRDVRVIDDECTFNGFKRPSVAAALKFKYKPRVINGEAVEVENVRNLFTFELQSSDGSRR